MAKIASLTQKQIEEIKNKLSEFSGVPRGYRNCLTFALWSLREAIPSLLAEVERLQAELAQTKGET